MNVYQVIFDRYNDDEVIEVIEYVSAYSFKAVSDRMFFHAKQMGWELKCVRYLLTIVETIPKKEEDE